MKPLTTLIIAALVVALVIPLSGQIPDAAQVLASARDALGGEKKLSAVRTFTVTGRTRQLRGNNLVPIEFEINCELPDKFVRRDEFPAQDADPTTQGFNGETLLQFPAPSPGRGAAPAIMRACSITSLNPKVAAQSMRGANSTHSARASDFVKLDIGEVWKCG